MRPLCYLCGKRIAARRQSDDHVVPRVLLEGQPPKAKGQDYGGVLPSHVRCNNEFGPESYATRALELIDALHRPECAKAFTHPKDPSISLMAISSDCLKNFRPSDLRYFKIDDRSAHRSTAIPPASEFVNAQNVNPYRQSLFVALAVLLKSAAALLIKRKLPNVPSTWQVMAVPFVGDAGSVDFDDLFGKTMPFSAKVNVWAGILTTDDALVIYRADRVLVYFFFKFSRRHDGWRRMRSQFVEQDRLRFDGGCIRDVLHSGWKRV